MILHRAFLLMTESTFGATVKSISSFAPFWQVTFIVTTSEDPLFMRSKAASFGTFALIFFLVLEELNVNVFGLSFIREVFELNAMHAVDDIKSWAVAINVI